MIKKSFYCLVFFLLAGCKEENNIKVEQANFYNYNNPDDPIYIDYQSLPKPDLDDMKEEIEKLSRTIYGG